MGQNASQSYCLILHLPFMFYDSRQKLIEFWPTLEALLVCYQVVMSVKITDQDLILLRGCIEKLLNGLIALNGHLTPKPHNLTHYVSTITKVGPLKHGWMMRYEAKHRFFTDKAKITHNFMNLRYSLALAHQEEMSLRGFSIEDDIEEGKKCVILFQKHSQFSKYEQFLRLRDDHIDFDQLFILPSLKFNNYTYKPGLFLIENFKIYCILFVMRSENGYFFLCQIYDKINYEQCLNSIEIELTQQEEKLELIKHSDLLNKQSFEQVIYGSKKYIIAENLSVCDMSGVEMFSEFL